MILGDHGAHLAKRLGLGEAGAEVGGVGAAGLGELLVDDIQGGRQEVDALEVLELGISAGLGDADDAEGLGGGAGEAEDADGGAGDDVGGGLIVGDIALEGIERLEELVEGPVGDGDAGIEELEGGGGIVGGVVGGVLREFLEAGLAHAEGGRKLLDAGGKATGEGEGGGREGDGEERAAAGAEAVRVSGRAMGHGKGGKGRAVQTEKGHSTGRAKRARRRGGRCWKRWREAVAPLGVAARRVTTR